MSIYPTINFSTSTPARKKAQKPAKGDHHSSSSSTNDTPASADAFDSDEHFATLETELAKIIEKLKDDLSKLRTSRVDPSLFEGVTVIMDKTTNETVLLKDIAHVVVKGRNLSVGVYEADVCPSIHLLNCADEKLIARIECQKGIHSSAESGIEHHPHC